MRIKSSRYKAWKKKRDKKIWLKRHLKVILVRRKRKKGKTIKREKKNHRIFSMPSNFSLVDNYSEMIDMLIQIEKWIKNKKSFLSNIFLDMSSVTNVTADALMYLLAFIKNSRASPDHPIMIGGNLPKDEKSRKTVLESGFLDYLKTKIPETKPSANVKMHCGTNVDGLAIMEICKFIHEKSNLKRVDTLDLYNTLGEIIGNSNEHAYPNENTQFKWLTFAWLVNDNVRIVVLDTGKGIINTISEKITEKISPFKDRCELLKSAMKGEKRSQTKKHYRNRGLPRIIFNAKEGVLRNLTLFTNDVYYKCEYNNGRPKDSFKLLDKNLKGTLYYFDFSLRRTKDE